MYFSGSFFHQSHHTSNSIFSTAGNHNVGKDSVQATQDPGFPFWSQIPIQQLVDPWTLLSWDLQRILQKWKKEKIVGSQKKMLSVDQHRQVQALSIGRRQVVSNESNIWLFSSTSTLFDSILWQDILQQAKTKLIFNLSNTERLSHHLEEIWIFIPYLIFTILSLTLVSSDGPISSTNFLLRLWFPLSLPKSSPLLS